VLIGVSSIVECFATLSIYLLELLNVGSISKWINVFKLISALLLAAMTSVASAATLTATVDRKQISENESFRLFLRYDEQVAFSQPDLDALKPNFRVISQQKSNQFRSVNGKTTSYTEWAISLSPERTGELVIPAISFKGESSQPIKITVNKLSQAVKDKMAKEFFFDIDIDTTSTYVQGQILYTEKLYYSINHEDATLSEFKVTDAHVMPLGEVRQYTTTIDGQRLGVYERRFAIFPEESGELVIPGQRFNASIVNPYNRWSRGRPVSVVAEPLRIEVKPIANGYPQSPWLPSTQVTVQDSWSKKPSEWKVGEPVTRTIIVRANGLSGSQLPGIALPVSDKLKYYPDQSEHNDHIDETGITGIRQESMAIVPTTSGRVKIAEVRIPWWNTELNKIEYAIIPAQTVTVAEATLTQASPSAQASTVTEASVTSSEEDILKTSGAQGIWMIAALVLLLTNVITAFLLWRRPAAVQAEAGEKPEIKADKLKKAVNKACVSNDPLAIRNALKLWSQAEFGDSSFSSLKALNNQGLNNALDALDSHLFSPNKDEAFNGQIIWASLKQALSARTELTTSRGLKPLYQ